MGEVTKLKQNKEFIKDKKSVENLFKKYKKAFSELKEKYPLKSHYLQMMCSDSIEFQNKNLQHKINIRYGYDEMFPSEEYVTDEERWHKGQIGTAIFKDKWFYADSVSDNVEFEFGKEFKIEHDIIVGLPVYITITEIWD